MTRAAIAVLALLLATLGIAGCQSPKGPTSRPAGAAGDAATVDPRLLAAIVVEHNERLEKLQAISSVGVIELAWTDADGDEHFEPQVRAWLWLELPRRSALRAEKFGNLLFFIGSDDDRYWFFDFLEDESRLYTAAHGEAVREGALLVHPLALIDLMGLSPLPDDRLPPAAIDAGAGTVVVTALGAGGPMRVHFDPIARLPVRVESLSAAGDVVMHSTLDPRRYERVRTDDPPLVRPRMPTNIDLADAEGRVKVKIALEAPADERKPALFDLDRLIQHLRPDR